MTDALAKLISLVLVYLLNAFFIMMLWNFTITDLFQLSEITYWQSVYLVILVECFKTNYKEK